MSNPANRCSTALHCRSLISDTPSTLAMCRSESRPISGRIGAILGYVMTIPCQRKGHRVDAKGKRQRVADGDHRADHEHEMTIICSQTYTSPSWWYE